MTWFKVDDQLAFHPKFVAIGLSAAGVWVRAGSWCGAQLTDGFVPAGIAAALGATRRETDALVAQGLWEVTDGGWRFRDWEFYQPTREEELTKRANKAAAGKAGGQASGRSRRAKQEPKQNRSSCFDSASPARSSASEPPSPYPSLSAAAAALTPPPPVDNSAASNLPNSLVILRAALEARKLLVRWDRLTPEHVTAIDGLITTHGDERLVHAAMQAHRPDRPAAFAQAWIGVWQSLPDPGSRLRVVRARCEKPGHEHEDAQHCRACASEGKAKEAHA